MSHHPANEQLRWDPDSSNLFYWIHFPFFHKISTRLSNQVNILDFYLSIRWMPSSFKQIRRIEITVWKIIQCLTRHGTLSSREDCYCCYHVLYDKRGKKRLTTAIIEYNDNQISVVSSIKSQQMYQHLNYILKIWYHRQRKEKSFIDARQLTKTTTKQFPLEEIKIVPRSIASPYSTTNFTHSILLLVLQSFLDHIQETIENFAGNRINAIVLRRLLFMISFYSV